VQREHIAAAEPAGREPGGDPRHAVGQLAVGDRPSGLAGDDRRAVGEAVGVAQHEGPEVHGGDLRLGPGAAHHPVGEDRGLHPK
jgi:hypothetical protein